MCGARGWLARNTNPHKQQQYVWPMHINQVILSSVLHKANQKDILVVARLVMPSDEPLNNNPSQKSWLSLMQQWCHTQQPLNSLIISSHLIMKTFWYVNEIYLRLSMIHRTLHLHLPRLQWLRVNIATTFS